MVDKKKVLIHSIVFSPDSISTAYLYNDIALRFKDEQYEVVVLTTTPHYNPLPSELKKQPLKSKLFGLYYISYYHGIKVIHTRQRKFRSSFLRIVGFIYWHVISFFLGLFEKNVKLILSPSPPLSIGIINVLLGALKGAKVIYNVQEIYPDFLINQGKLKMPFIVSLLKSMERLVYSKSDAVTTIDEVFYRTIINRFDNREKLKIIPNFVDTELFKPLSHAENSLDERIFYKNDKVLKIMYAGNIGYAQNWEPLLKLAKALTHYTVEFWIIGEGVLKSYLEQQISLLGLKNIRLLPYQHRKMMPSLISYADLHFIFMAPEMDGQGFPSKVYTIMACAKPLLVISGEETPISKFLIPLNCAFLIDDKGIDIQCAKMFSIIIDLLEDKSQLAILGRNGLKHVKAYYTKDVVTMQYVKLGTQLMNNK